MEDPKKYEEAIKEDLKNYTKLEKINNSDEFNDFFELQISTVVQKILWMFATHKEAVDVQGNTRAVDNVKNWDDFCRVRGEVIAFLYPIQQIRGAKVMKKQLREQLNTLYNTEPS